VCGTATNYAIMRNANLSFGYTMTPDYDKRYFSDGFLMMYFMRG